MRRVNVGDEAVKTAQSKALTVQNNQLLGIEIKMKKLSALIVALFAAASINVFAQAAAPKAEEKKAEATTKADAKKTDGKKKAEEKKADAATAAAATAAPAAAAPAKDAKKEAAKK